MTKRISNWYFATSEDTDICALARYRIKLQRGEHDFIVYFYNYDVRFITIEVAKKIFKLLNKQPISQHILDKIVNEQCFHART